LAQVPLSFDELLVNLKTKKKTQIFFFKSSKMSKATILSLLALSGVSQGLTVKYVGKNNLSAEDQFEAFKFKYNKVYADDMEHAVSL